MTEQQQPFLEDDKEIKAHLEQAEQDAGSADTHDVAFLEEDQDLKEHLEQAEQRDPD